MNTLNTKSIEPSIKEKIKNIAKKQNRTFNDVWQEVILERWLARLAISLYRKNFIFKGAMCLLHYVDLQRETRDLDFLIKDLAISIDDVRKYLEEVSAITLMDGFIFENLKIELLPHIHMKYPGYQVSIIGTLGDTKTKIFIDIGVGDVVNPTELTMQLLGTEKAPLFEKEIYLWAYPVESIFAEKLETAIVRADQNSRMKDYHDLLLLVRKDVLNKKIVKSTIKITFTNRGTRLQKLSIQKEQIENIQRYWKIYLKTTDHITQKNLSTDIKMIINEINHYLDEHDLIENN